MGRSPRFLVRNSALLCTFSPGKVHLYNKETVTLFKVVVIIIIYTAEFIEIKDEGSWANLN